MEDPENNYVPDDEKKKGVGKKSEARDLWNHMQASWDKDKAEDYIKIMDIREEKAKQDLENAKNGAQKFIARGEFFRARWNKALVKTSHPSILANEVWSNINERWNNKNKQESEE